MQGEAQALFAVMQWVGLIVRALAQEFCRDVCQDALQWRLCIWCQGRLAQPLQLACCAQLGQQRRRENLQVGSHHKK